MRWNIYCRKVRRNTEGGFLLADSLLTCVVGTLMILSLLTVITGMCWQWHRIHTYERALQDMVTLVETKKAAYHEGASLASLEEEQKNGEYRYVVTTTTSTVSGMALPTLVARCWYGPQEISTYTLYLYRIE